MGKLLDKAKSMTRRKDFKRTNDEIELAFAWLKGEVSLKAMMNAIGYKHSNSSYALVAIAIREAFRTGQLIVNPKHTITLTPLSEDAQKERLPDWKPEYMGALHDTIETLPTKSRPANSSRYKKPNP